MGTRTSFVPKPTQISPKPQAFHEVRHEACSVGIAVFMRPGARAPTTGALARQAGGHWFGRVEGVDGWNLRQPRTLIILAADDVRSCGRTERW